MKQTPSESDGLSDPQPFCCPHTSRVEVCISRMMLTGFFKWLQLAVQLKAFHLSIDDKPATQNNSFESRGPERSMNTPSSWCSAGPYLQKCPSCDHHTGTGADATPLCCFWGATINECTSINEGHRQYPEIAFSELLWIPQAPFKVTGC